MSTLTTTVPGSLSKLPELVTIGQWAEAFGVCDKTVYRMCEDGQLKVVRLRNAIRIMRDPSLEMLGIMPRKDCWGANDDR